MKNLSRRNFFCMLSAVVAFFLFSSLPANAQGKIFNVKNAPYFAKGDGVTDDSAALQQAFNAATATAGNTIYVPAGNYSHSANITLNANKTSLLGAGKNASLFVGFGRFIVQGSNVSITGIGGTNLQNLELLNLSKGVLNGLGFPNSTVVTFNSSDVQVLGGNFYKLRFDGGSRLAVSNSNLANSTMNERLIEFISVTDATVKQVTSIANEGYPLFVGTSTNVLIEGSTLRAAGAGIPLYISGSSSVTVQNNSISAAPGGALQFASYVYFGQNIFLRANQMSRSNYGAYAYYTVNAQITGNTISDVGTAGVGCTGNIMTITGNQISRSNNYGIILYGVNNTDKPVIDRNFISNCGLVSTGGVIYVLDNFGTSFPVSIQNNVYTGNRNNVAYFVNCECTAPPAVVKGNITTTMLPSKVGP